MFNEADLTALAITLKLALISTLVLLLIGTPLAWWLFIFC
jgi:molybdate transport system permease protein